MSDSWDPMDCSPPGSSVHGIFQARILEWVPIPFSKGSSWPISLTYIYYFHLSLFFSPKYSSLSKVLYIIYLIYFLSSPTKCKFPKDKHFNPLCSVLSSILSIVSWVLSEYFLNWMNKWMILEILSLKCSNEEGHRATEFFCVGGSHLWNLKICSTKNERKKEHF